MDISNNLWDEILPFFHEWYKDEDYWITVKIKGNPFDVNIYMSDKDNPWIRTVIVYPFNWDSQLGRYATDTSVVIYRKEIELLRLL